jgi:hypothetical protein
MAEKRTGRAQRRVTTKVEAAEECVVVKECLTALKKKKTTRCVV